MIQFAEYSCPHTIIPLKNWIMEIDYTIGDEKVKRFLCRDRLLHRTGKKEFRVPWGPTIQSCRNETVEKAMVANNTVRKSRAILNRESIHYNFLHGYCSGVYDANE